MPSDVLAAPVHAPDPTPPIYVEHTTRRALALDRDADVFFGLLPGTNGTGPAMRRACVPEGYAWLTSDMRPARGVLLVPSSDSDSLQTNPWSGR